MNSIESLPRSDTLFRLDFESAEVVPGMFSETWVLIVTGQASCINMKVSLEPLYYGDMPDYWGIEVVGKLPGGMCLPTMKSFTEALPLCMPIGNKGIEVIGATMNLLIDVPPIG